MSVGTHLAIPFEEYIQELGGTPTKFREKLIDIISIYSKPLTEANYRKYLVCNSGSVSVYDLGRTTPLCAVISKEQPIQAYPKTIGELITVCKAFDEDLYWDNDTYKSNIFFNSKYK